MNSFKNQPIIKYVMVVFILFSWNQNLYSQEKKISRTRFVIGLSAPELLHAGLTYRIANASQIGLSVGAGPSLGTIWPSINLEHRLYFGKNSIKTTQKSGFSAREQHSSLRPNLLRNSR